MKHDREIILGDLGLDDLYKLAVEGEPHAQYALGYLYFYGEGVLHNRKEAFKWFERAGRQGNVSAQKQVGLMYQDGLGVGQDEKRAMEWLAKAAKYGSFKGWILSRRNFLHGFLGTLFIPLFAGCDQPETELVLEKRFPIFPYIQNISRGSATILWKSADDQKGTVQIFNESGGLAAQVKDSSTQFHEITVDGLEEDTAYFYQVKEGNNRVGPMGSFRTALPSESTESFSFVALGCSGEGTKRQFQVADQILALTNPAFIIHTGDVVYDGYEREYPSKFFSPYRALIYRVPMYPVLGDHDLEDDAKAFFKFFSLPRNPIEQTTDYYSFTYGNALFVALNSTRMLDPGESGFNLESQISFLTDELANSTATWKFIYLHKPLFTNGEGRFGSEDLRNRIQPIAQEYGVTLVFYADTHAYERFLLHGVTYITTGGGGAELRKLEPGREKAADLQASASEYHFVHVLIEDKDLSLTAYDFKGETIDTFQTSSS